MRRKHPERQCAWRGCGEDADIKMLFRDNLWAGGKKRDIWALYCHDHYKEWKSFRFREPDEVVRL